MRAGTRLSKASSVAINTLALAQQLISRRSVSPDMKTSLADFVAQLPKIYLQTLKNLLIN